LGKKFQKTAGGRFFDSHCITSGMCMCSANETLARKLSFNHQTTVDSTSTDILEYNSRSLLQSLVFTAFKLSHSIFLGMSLSARSEIQ